MVDNREFARAFRREIAPQLPALEAHRRRLLRRTLLYAGLVLVAFMMAAAIFPVFGEADLHQSIGAMGVAVFGGLFVAWKLYARAGEALAGKVQEAVMPVVCRCVGDLQFRRRPSDYPYLKRFQDLWVTEKFHLALSGIEDEFCGRHGDIAFRMVKTRLRRPGDETTVTVLKGILLVIEVPVRFSGRIILTRDLGNPGNRFARKAAKRRGLEWVPFDDVKFEGVFEVFADEAAEARKLLAPRLRESLVEIADLSRLPLPRPNLYAGFDAGEFLLALPRPSRPFAISGLLRPVTRLQGEMDRLLTEVTIPHRVIDYLRGERPDWA